MTVRIGLIIPSSNRMVEDEMVHAFPHGVRAHVTRLRMTGDSKGPLDKLMPKVEEATRALVDAHCEVVAFHCTANSMQEGRDGEARILAALQRAGAPRATTTATAVQRALKALDARKIVLVTPYTQAVTDHEAEFLREAGYATLSAKGHALAGADAYCATPSHYWRDSLIASARPDADVYFLSCAAIQQLGVIEDVEARLGRPVITSNQVVIWDTLRSVGDGRRGPGRLFAAVAPAPVAAHA